MWTLILVFSMAGQPGVTSEQIKGFKIEAACDATGEAMQKQAMMTAFRVIGYQCVPIDSVSVELKMLEQKVKEAEQPRDSFIPDQVQER